ncbi:hypothetical protein CROQUDRAFT_655655 [Cronartium quercuum f. sp. fusiforme G11]|uniref:Mitochondrial processing peptidase n=1 Tax=Cronartium quercuum f. sp. fusiforme G11 TaxID=708437 RepID=A0A9P6TD04_9BASI|nr:hypothetical protein CROQUDRAFT_655655 [Cronartium quercuum f. sp. fusiforme G11]
MIQRHLLRSTIFNKNHHRLFNSLPFNKFNRNYSTQLTNELTQISTLSNGIRVATEPTPGHFIGVGVYVDAGSRYESERIRGATHLTDRMAFKSTKNRTTEQMSLEIEQLGGSFFASSGRDTVVYQATSYPNSLDSVLSVLSDTSLHPLLLQSELEIEQDAAEWEVNEISKKPEYMIPELLHETAFPNNTLGLPLICPKDRIRLISPGVMWEYRSLFYKPERIVVAGVGVDHQNFLKSVQNHFGQFKPIHFPQLTSHLTGHPNSSHGLFSKDLFSKAYATSTNHHHHNISPLDPLTGLPLQTFEELVSAKAYYRGGEVRLKDDGESKLAHVYIGFEAPNVHDPDLYAIACTHIMLGGGSSFSAGGPGKGMYSRLYTGVLNPHPEVDFCQAFHHSYSDSGLFGIAMSVLPEFVGKVPQIIASQLDSISRPNLRGGLNEEQLERSKNQLRSTMMYGLESRLLQVEDLGRQVQTVGRKRPWSEIWKSIEAITMSDIHRAVSRIIRPEPGGFSGEPTIVATGNIDRLGDVREMLGRYGIGSPTFRAKGWW